MTTMPPEFTVEEKLNEIDRELTQRHRVYAWQVRNGKMTKETAQRQIWLMMAIKKDYADKAKEGPLFAQREIKNAV